MKKNDFYFYLSVLLLVLILILSSYVYFNFSFSSYKHVVEKKGVSFVSNTDDPSDVLDRLRASNNILLVVDFDDSGNTAAYSTNVVTLFTTIFVAKGHKLTLLARSVGEKGDLVSCMTNYGDLKRNEVISIEECSKMFSDSSLPALYVALPKPAQTKPLVILSGSRVEIYSHSLEALPFVSFVVAESIYDDASSLVDNVNFLVSKL